MYSRVQALLKSLSGAGESVGSVEMSAWGRDISFVVRTVGCDTIILEDGIWDDLENGDPLMILKKSALNGESGIILTCSHGNHAVSLVPLLSNKFPGVCDVDVTQRSRIISDHALCANVVKDTIELSQRGVGMKTLVESDGWLRQMGLTLDSVVMGDRLDETLEHYRAMGQEWRVKPLAWTRDEMLHALKDSRATLHSNCTYFHSVKGVHFVSYVEFFSAARLCRDDFDAFVNCLKEWIGSQNEETPLMFLEKFHGHHEVELFGLTPGVSEETILPSLHALLHGIETDDISQERVYKSFCSISDLYGRSLMDVELQNEASDLFIECMYKHLTGVVYQSGSRDLMLRFDDRRTALPGATYVGGEKHLHPGVDPRTLALLDYVESRLNHAEEIQSANVYEIRSQESGRLGEGRTREIVYVTNMHPVPQRSIEKRLAHASSGYGEYTLTRVQAFQSLGLCYGDHHLLERIDRKSGNVHYYVRQRYPGVPSNAIPNSYFLTDRNDDKGDVEDKDAVLLVAALLGEAAAQNAILKKYIPGSRTNRFGVGKEIIEFGYDMMRGRELPMKVWLCSVRGTLGWPSTERTEENLRFIAEYYAESFASVVVDFLEEHENTVSLSEVEHAFVNGFAGRTREAYWNYNSQRELFDSFDPPLQAVYAFKEKFAFALWTLVQQHRRLRDFRNMLARRIRREAAHRGVGVRNAD